MRYFYGENADRPIRAGGVSHVFTIVGRVAGTSQGVVAVEDGRAEAFKAVATPFGVIEITAEMHDELLRKKKANPRLPASVALPSAPPSAPAAIKGKGAVVVDGSAVVKPQEAPKPESIDELIEIGVAREPTAPPAPVEAAATTKRQNRKARAAE